MRKNLGGMGMPELHIHVQVKTKNGIILDDRWEKGHSWTRNAWNAFNGVMIDGFSGSANSMFKNGMLNGVTTGGVLYADAGQSMYNRYGGAGGGCYNNAVGNAAYGIIVGTNNGGLTFHPNAFALNNQVGHGNGAGQLSHTAQNAPVTTYDADTKKWNNVVTRIFNNNSGGTITIRELGLVFYSGIACASVYSFLFAHDILEEEVELPDTGQLTVTYSMTTQALTVDEDFPTPAFGAAGSGGYVAGFAWHPTLNVTDFRYLLIAASVGGAGHSTSKQFRTANTNIPNTDDRYRGQNNMAGLYAVGADSPLGTLCSDANTAELGGYDDWYVPADYEMLHMLFPRRASLPAGEEWANNYYMSSTSVSGTFCYSRQMSTGQEYSDYYNAAKYVRLIRKIRTDEFVPAE